MKKIALTILLLSSFKTVSIEIPFVPDITLPEVVVNMDRPQYLKDFLRAMGKKESGNNYDIVNTLGYLGKYQFGETTLERLGIVVSKEEFLSTPHLQETAMHRLLHRHKKILRKEIEKYDGTIFKNINVTESGILAAAHLGGAGSVQKFFRNGRDKKDSYGTKVSDYMKQFGGYRLELN